MEHAQKFIYLKNSFSAKKKLEELIKINMATLSEQEQQQALREYFASRRAAVPRGPSPVPAFDYAQHVAVCEESKDQLCDDLSLLVLRQQQAAAQLQTIIQTWASGKSIRVNDLLTAFWHESILRGQVQGFIRCMAASQIGVHPKLETKEYTDYDQAVRSLGSSNVLDMNDYSSNLNYEAFNNTNIVLAPSSEGGFAREVLAQIPGLQSSW